METDTSTISENRHLASVVEFFLNLYKRQLDADEASEAKIVPIPSHSDSPDYIYEFHVEREKDKWSSRRMTIAAIGEGSGSKSKCFKVAYDNLIVVKIPPGSITDFREYIRGIRSEGRIAVNLAPAIEYVAPGETALLKKIHAFSDGEELSPENLEKRYVRWLIENPDFQEYLKIGESFVFFMDLSKNYFLSYVVDSMHDKRAFKGRFQEEIMEARNLLWDILGFEGKYGSENLSICFDMNRIYSDYESNMRKLMRKYDPPPPVSPYEKQKWFLDCLAEKKSEKNLPPQFAANVDIVLKKVMKKNKKEIGAYKRAVKNYISENTFAQNRAKMAGIITNIIDLLAVLKERGVAIRDLKPDNLFVVGDSERTAEDYSLGLIDFETSVKLKIIDFRKSDEICKPIPAEKIAQPLLAGTPSYATPSHLFRNEILRSLFDGLPRILYVQDWHAAIGMIYNVVTGECLFEKTRRLLSQISRDARDALRKKESLTDVFKKGSRVFWSSALYELKERITEKKGELKAVEVFIPENTQEMFLEDILREKHFIYKKIQYYVASQTIFNSKKDRKSLIVTPLEKLIRYRTKLEKEGIPEMPLNIRKRIIRWLQGLEELKRQSEKQKRWVKLLKKPNPKISVYELLELMFTLILRTMYKDEWGSIYYEPEDDLFDNQSDDPSGETTIVYDDTITYDEEV